jgi:hypothetical protein
VADQIPPGRPIIGNSLSEDTAICKYIDTFLQPIVARQPYILSNTDHLLSELDEAVISQNSYLFTLDVSSLYTNIPIVKGIEAVKYYFDKFPDPTRPSGSILKLLTISLFKNDFLFDKKYFRQIKGVAMGKQYAPNFANLYMCRWEEHVLHHLSEIKPTIWLRYIDDIFGIWDGSLTGLHEFIKTANAFDANIQLTCNVSLTDIQFLDVVIFKTKELKLFTMVYLKPTSSLKLIHPRSLHPKHTKTGAIFSQILRFYKNCSLLDDFNCYWKCLFVALLDQGYSRSQLRTVKQNALSYLNSQVDDNGKLLKGFFPCESSCKLCVEYGLKQSKIIYPGGCEND